MIGLSALLLIASLAVLGMLQFPQRWPVIPFQWWIHLGILALLFLGFRELAKLRKAGTGQPFRLRNGISWWAAPVAIIVVVVAAPFWGPSSFDLGTMPDGSPVHSKTTYTENGKHFQKLNNSYVRELSTEEFQASERDAQEMFSRVWVLFSAVALLFWHYLGRRREHVEAGASGDTGPWGGAPH